MKEYIECVVVDRKNDHVKARVKMHSDCSSCGLCEGSHAVYYEALNNANATCGQNVLIEVEKQSVLKIAFILFCLPLLTIVISSTLGVYLANVMHSSSLFTAIGLSFVTLIPIIYFIKKYDAKVKGKSNMPVITKII